MKKLVIILGTAHLITTPGKCSPDGKFREPVWSREIVDRLEAELKARGYMVFIDYKPLEPNFQMKSNMWRTEQSRELRYRVNFVNDICRQYGAQNCVYLSIHNNACPPNDGQWHKATGFSIWVAHAASAKSKRLAQLIYDEAAAAGLAGNRSVPANRYWVADFYVLKNTACPAILSENLFQDNKSDVAILQSELGKDLLVNAHLHGIENFAKEYGYGE